jgi:hypothetical protein
MRRFLFAFATLIALTTSLALGDFVYHGPQCVSNCSGDVGPKPDVNAVRGAVLHSDSRLIIVGVHVVHDYALVLWKPRRIAAYKRISGEQWKRIATGPTAQPSIYQHNVPPLIAQQLCSGWPKGQSPGC